MQFHDDGDSHRSAAMTGGILAELWDLVHRRSDTAGGYSARAISRFSLNQMVARFQSWAALHDNRGGFIV